MSFIQRIFSALLKEPEKEIVPVKPHKNPKPTKRVILLPKPASPSVFLEPQLRALVSSYDQFLTCLKVWNREGARRAYMSWEGYLQVLVEKHTNGKKLGALPQDAWRTFERTVTQTVCMPFKRLVPLFDLVSRTEVREVKNVRTKRDLLDQEGEAFENRLYGLSRSLDDLKNRGLREIALSFDSIPLGISDVRRMISTERVDEILRDPPDSIVITDRYCVPACEWLELVSSYAESRKYKFRYEQNRLTLYELSKTVQTDVISYCDRVERFSLSLLPQARNHWVKDFLKLEFLVLSLYGQFESSFSYQTQFIRQAYPQLAMAGK